MNRTITIIILFTVLCFICTKYIYQYMDTTNKEIVLEQFSNKTYTNQVSVIPYNMYYKPYRKNYLSNQTNEIELQNYTEMCSNNCSTRSPKLDITNVLMGKILKTIQNDSILNNYKILTSRYNEQCVPNSDYTLIIGPENVGKVGTTYKEFSKIEFEKIYNDLLQRINYEMLVQGVCNKGFQSDCKQYKHLKHSLIRFEKSNRTERYLFELQIYKKRKSSAFIIQAYAVKHIRKPNHIYYQAISLVSRSWEDKYMILPGHDKTLDNESEYNHLYSNPVFDCPTNFTDTELRGRAKYLCVGSLARGYRPESINVDGRRIFNNISEERHIVETKEKQREMLNQNKHNGFFRPINYEDPEDVKYIYI